MPVLKKGDLYYVMNINEQTVSRNLMEQMKNVVDIAEVKYKSDKFTLLWLFDQSSCHRKFGEHALLVKNILVKDGGPRRVRDTVWARQPQVMVNEDGSAKGLKTILRERGINTERMLADDMRVVLSNREDFATEKTILEHYLEERGHIAHFLPKFHCELNAIERVWGRQRFIVALTQISPWLSYVK